MLRDTAQRQAIRRVLKEASGPLDAEELLKSARRITSKVGIATVYRSIKVLIATGKVTAGELPGEPPRYESAGKGHHHHFHCERCGRVYELAGCPGQIEGLLPRGFRMRNHDLLVRGRCASCAR